MSRLILLLRLPPSKTHHPHLLSLQNQGFNPRTFSLLLSTSNHRLGKKLFVSFSLDWSGLERALASTVLLKTISSLRQNPFPSCCNPPTTHPFDPLSLPACSCGKNGPKDEAPSKKKISPWAGRKHPQEKASCSVLHCSHSGFSVCSRSLSVSP